MIFQLTKSSLLSGLALNFFMDKVEEVAESTESADHYLGKRVRRVNDKVWMDLSFDYLKSKRNSKGLDSSYEEVLNELITAISELSDLRTGSSMETDIIAKTIASVRDIEVFAHVCKNPPGGLQDLNSTLRYSNPSTRELVMLEQVPKIMVRQPMRRLLKRLNLTLWTETLILQDSEDTDVQVAQGQPGITGRAHHYRQNPKNKPMMVNTIQLKIWSLQQVMSPSFVRQWQWVLTLGILT